jgi:hypothetical protein
MASQLARTINRWAGEVLPLAAAPAAAAQDAALAGAGEVVLFADVRPMMVQSLLRHAMARGAVPPSASLADGCAVLSLQGA